MARHNEVFLYGKILKDPLIYYDEKEDIYQRGMFSLMTIQGQRDIGTYIDHLQYQTPTIMSRDHEIVKEIAKWKQGDMVEIKGTITTQEIMKKSKCSSCGQSNLIPKANVVYITPIYIGLRERNQNEKEALELLKKRCEISNQAIVIGNLCRDPSFYRDQRGRCVTQYQLAINRKYYIADDPMVKTDYPWVRSRGEIAIRDSKTLITGSSVMIDGFLQTRVVERKTQCEHCGAEYTWKDTIAMEIVPYSVEYLKNCKDLEEIEKEEQKEVEGIVDSILS